MVYQCLQSGGLEDFYSIIQSEGERPRRARVSDRHQYLCDPDFVDEFAWGEEKNHFLFYMEGVDCMACAWVFRNIESISEQIVWTKFHHENNVFEIYVAHSSVLPEVARFIEGLGYRLIPLKNMQEAESRYRIEKRRELKRMGVTGALLMNTMIYSVSLYAGASGYFQNLFAHLSAILFIPVVLYSAIPFYKSMWSGLVNKRASLDIPIGCSIVLGSGLSYWNYFQGREQYYFDSIAMFIFLILSTRYLLSWFYRRERAATVPVNIYGEQQVVKVGASTDEFKHISQIGVGDKIRVSKGSIVPLDGVIDEGESWFNESLLTGESEPVFRRVGDRLKAGSKNMARSIDLTVESSDKSGSFQNYLSALRWDVTTLKEYAELGGRYSTWLVATLFLISLCILLVENSLDKVLSLFIICCPCALGIGIPLATLLKIKSFVRQGILIRDKNIFEKYGQIRKICFDKTGTLTTGEYQIEKFSGDTQYLKYLVALEQYSEHPVAGFFCRHYSSHQDSGVRVEHFKEIPGRGVEGVVEGRHFCIVANERGEIVMESEGAAVLTFQLSETIVSGLVPFMTGLSKRWSIEIISGDSHRRVEKLMGHFPREAKIVSRHSLTPQEKERHCLEGKGILYVGDGLNDIFAMKKSILSVSLNAGKLADDACSVIFLGGDVKKLTRLFDGIEHLGRVVRGNILLSVIYNIIGVGLVLSGQINPLVAAILMPLSSLFVICNIFVRMR